jgi:hypothetical protein
MTTVLVLNGPNLDRLGRREPDVYGSTSYDELVAMIEAEATELGLNAVVRQSNSEAQLLDWLHAAADAGDPVILNAGALTHTSIVSERRGDRGDRGSRCPGLPAGPSLPGQDRGARHRRVRRHRLVLATELQIAVEISDGTT